MLLTLQFYQINFKQGDAVDENGIHADVHVQSIGDTDNDGDKTSHTLNKTRLSADTEEFFKPIPLSVKVPGDKKKWVKCIPCVYVLNFS